MSTIFLSHSSRDDGFAVKLRDWLLENGWADVFLDLDPSRGLAPGERWQEALRSAADRCEAVVCIVSDAWLASRWCITEFLLAMQLGKRIFPVTIGAVNLDALPVELTSNHQVVSLDGDANGWDRLREGLKRAGLDPSSFSFEKGRRPYPGFEPLTEEDAAVFFGREAHLIRCLDTLRHLRQAGAERLMVLLGASGAGKSSFLRAGLYPRLKRDFRNFVPLPIIRPERGVLTGKSGFCSCLQRHITKLTDWPVSLPTTAPELATFLEQPGAVVQVFDAIRAAGADRTGLFSDRPPSLVLLIDQGEELIDPIGRVEHDKFIQILSHALSVDRDLIVIMGVRSDSFPAIQAQPGFTGLPFLPFDLRPMPIGTLRSIITGPAEVIDPPLKLDPALVDALVDDAEGKDALPILAFTLGRLYSAYGHAGKIDLDQYKRLGGTKGAIAAAVEEALSVGQEKNLLPADATQSESLLRQLFLPHLVRVNEFGQVTRRVALRQEIPAPLHPLAELLVDERILTADVRQGGSGAVDTIEIAHEALLREWSKLADWIEKERLFLEWREELQRSMASWTQAPVELKKTALLSGYDLVRSADFYSTRQSDLAESEQKFIMESVPSSMSFGLTKKEKLALGIFVGLFFGFTFVAAAGKIALVASNPFAAFTVASGSALVLIFQLRNIVRKRQMIFVELTERMFPAAVSHITKDKVAIVEKARAVTKKPSRPLLVAIKIVISIAVVAGALIGMALLPLLY